MTAYKRILAACFALAFMPCVAQAALSLQPQVASTPIAASAKSGKPAEQRPVLLAQAGDTAFRMGQMEEQIRALNGRVEEMNFLLLQMQEQMRQMQEDNEFRFQEIEGGTGNRTEAAPQGERDVAVVDPSEGPADPPRDLGTITFDESGELVGGSASEPAAQDDTQTASLPAGDAEQLYRAAYGYVLSGDYQQAEAAFNDYIARYPQEPKIADAYFWLGEAQYSQGSFHEAAKTLLTAHKQYPEAPKAPEMLLKLGMSLAALDNRDTACATYREVLTRYPNSSEAVKNKVAVEQSRMSC
ncbi:tol-pal system protein YbgF [Hoeflea prorocentri]|uniref:Cell division coordinator CpoB n=1 Tax=Hoeflea prorocentri TaxID=1922333 RepID=A0A9X3ZF55_9HYPH|nr:tol-pal system protein YbgF [Hoeflea prorocentri]MCY6379316.1 tol-pal system protein YbgF [Hoeflea prorocentri]MDA5397117.1 tol-pal system protein YbgF [Hoeflea prorocentri]